MVDEFVLPACATGDAAAFHARTGVWPGRPLKQAAPSHWFMTVALHGDWRFRIVGQALTNVLQNAQDSLAEAGAKDPQIALELQINDGLVALHITDSGWFRKSIRRSCSSIM